MGGARNSFCVVVLADHGGLATQGPRHRRLACLECINHVHLQRTGRGRGGKKRGRKGNGEKQRPRAKRSGQSRYICYLKEKKRTSLTPQLKSSVSTKSVWQERGWHRKIKRKVLCEELLFFRRKERLEGVRKKEREHKGNQFYEVLMSLNRTCANYFFLCIPLTMHDRYKIEIHEDFKSGMVGMEGER